MRGDICLHDRDRGIQHTSCVVDADLIIGSNMLAIKLHVNGVTGAVYASVSNLTHIAGT